ncbi:MAG: VWA domain-containing protein [Elusimicrobia bacterium]|nr:VWA domain-containing protein [Elusimicrobiota bacterium]
MTLMALMLGAAIAAEASAAKKPQVDVVFVLDTTGSMGSLLDAAKKKVWAIANEIAKGRPAPEVRMGLVAFRDKGDTYVTRHFDLTNDLDKVYGNLLSFQADGGGDGPEHVLQGLSDAIETMSWSRDSKALKLVYLVGDAPPHFDYPDAPKLEALLERGVRKGLIFNTIQCGSDSATQDAWRRVARLGEGKYLAIAHDGGVAAVSTPFDERLAELNREVGSTRVAFGRGRAKSAARKAREVSLLAHAAPAAAADRAAYMAVAGGSALEREEDLSSALEGGSVKLEALKDEELPEDWRGLTVEARKARLAAVNAKREALQKELASVAKRRDEYLKKESGGKDGFDAKLLESFKDHAARKGLSY